MSYMKKKYADGTDPVVVARLNQLIDQNDPLERKLEAIFHYVRDGILFGFPANGDLTTASETIQLGYGQCNTKSALFLALCKAGGIQAKIRFSNIRKEIQSGLFSGLLYKMMPRYLSHSWIELFYQNRWVAIDTFINDQQFYLNGKALLKQEGRKEGYSVSCRGGEAGSAFTLSGAQFVQMGSIEDDFGAYDEPGDFYFSSNYNNRPGFFKLLIYRIFRRGINRRVEMVRRGGGLVEGRCLLCR